MEYNKSEYGYILSWAKKIKAIELLGGKCEKCGETRPWVLSFHHKDLNEKEFDVSKIRLLRWSIIEKEVTKCILLCRNCHGELHKKIINKETIYDKSKKVLLDIKSISGCECCGYNEYNGSLDFHHIKDKLFTLHGIRLCENSCEDVKIKIINEINKCIILCANCHADLHFDKDKIEKYKNEIYNWKYNENKEPINKEEVMKLYNEGTKQIDIAKKFNRNKSVIHGIIKRYTAVGKEGSSV